MAAAFVWVLLPPAAIGALETFGGPLPVPAWLASYRYAAVALPALPFAAIGMLPVPAPRRTRWMALLIGFGVAVPAIAFLGCFALAYWRCAPAGQQPWIGSILLVGTLGWCGFTMREFRRRLSAKLVRRRFVVEPDRVTVRRSLQTEVSPPGIVERLPERGGFAIFVAWTLSGPFIQIGLTNADDVFRMTLLWLAMVTWPMAVALLAQICCGAYLWIYLAWRVEREQQRPVVLADDDRP